MFERGSGVFLNISSLPGAYGVGDFGRGAYEFIDLLASMGMSWWQILPLCPVGGGNSPYSSPSAFALNPLYVDLEALAQDGLLSREEIAGAVYGGSPYTADYTFAGEKKEALLRLAFSRADAAAWADFSQEQAFWLDAYAGFMAGKQANAKAPWWEWKTTGTREETEFYRFQQFVLFRQWQKALSYARKNGISILGDMPIYVSKDSADFWSNRGLFLTDEEGNLSKVAGVPPDYFSEDGQLWGNPLYDWAKMKEDGYRWWLSRIGHSLKLYHAVRIDHFRGFHRFWAVDADAKTAKQGQWMDGPGMDLFQKVNTAFEHPPILAEDLGTSDAELVRFLAETGYPGMKVMQFGFDSEQSSHIPYKYTENSIAYTGTHDNDTMLGWLWAIPMEEKKRLLKYCRYEGANWGEGGPQSGVIRAVITTLWQSAAALAIVPVQDLCGYGTDTRMNIPGRAEGNWQFRMTKEALAEIDVAFYRELNHTYGRIHQ